MSRLLLLAVLLSSLLLPTSFAAESARTLDGQAVVTADEEVRQRVERILASPAYQTEMPAEEAGEAPEARRDVPRWLAELMEIGLWLLAAGLLGLLAYLAVDAMRRRTSPPTSLEPPRPAAPPPPAAGPLSAPLPDPEALAGEGRFGEAVHALLLHALVVLVRRRDVRLPVSLTSREVLAASGLEGAPRQALGELVAAVERFLFAGRRLDADDWERCRRAFGTLDGSAEAAG